MGATDLHSQALVHLRSTDGSPLSSFHMASAQKLVSLAAWVEINDGNRVIYRDWFPQVSWWVGILVLQGPGFHSRHQ